MRPFFSRTLFSCVVALAAFSGTARAQFAGHVSSLVIDARTGAVLSESDADLQRYPASLTKMMTLYMTFQALERGSITLQDSMPVSIHASTQAPSKLGMRPGTHLAVEQAILALVTKSANDAACVLGEYLGGGDETRFAALMTYQARRLGMAHTTFRNASGLPDPDQVTTARDLSVLARALMRDFPQYYHYFGVREFPFRRHMIPNHDPLLGVYQGADGFKTGYTDLAGHNLVSSAQQGQVRLIGVVLGASSNESRNQTMISLLDDGFSASGQAPLPLLKQPGHYYALARHGGSRVAHRSHLRRGVVLVTYRSHGAPRGLHHSWASRRGHHRS